MKLFKCTSSFVQKRFSYYTTQAFPYVDELYRKNYMKYPTQSKLAVTHDYIFSGEERLPSLAERLKEFKDSSEELKNDLTKKVYYPKLNELKETIREEINKTKNDRDLIKAAKDLKIMVPLDEIHKQSKLIRSFKDILTIANHYNINKDLFHQSFFKPVLDLNVEYENSEKKYEVYHGNRLASKIAIKQPKIGWEDLLTYLKPDETVYHSLMFVNLDGNFEDSNKNVLLWFRGNMKNSDSTTGEENLSYMQPFPMRNTGWHRCVYVLFEHQKPIDFKFSPNSNSSSLLNERSFKAADFFSTYKNDIKPVGLSFFQTEWDISVKEFFHNKLNIEEPVYEFDFGPRFIPKFEKYPKGQVFNWYLQAYMDRKEISEDVMKKYLKDLSPFETYPEPAKYPILDVEHVRPKWYKYELESFRKRKHNWNLIPYKYSHEHKKIRESLKHLPYQQK